MCIFHGDETLTCARATLCVSDRSRCDAVRNLTSLAQPSRNCACQIGLVAARCEFWHRSRNLLGTLCISVCSRCGVSDRSRCGLV
jgi:enhancing lycopene biosynthesis protein 2